MVFARVRAFCLSLFLIAVSGSARDYFTEYFTGDFDLSYSTFTFKPDGSSNGYAVCRLPATEFPTPTNGASRLFNNLEWTRPLYFGTRTIPFFGEPCSELWINANGSVTFGASDDQDDFSISNHFRLPRVSAWLGKLGWEYSPNAIYHSVYYNQLSNRIALTWIDVPEGTNGGSNSLQLELFFDGVIRLTFLRMDASNGVVGLSPGGGVPQNFVESDLSNVGCAGRALYRIEWSSLPASVQVEQPFAVTLNGRDAFNLGFPVNGPARLLAGVPTVFFHADFENGTAGFTASNTSSLYSNAWHLTTYRGTQPGHSILHSMYSGRGDAPTPEERAVVTQGILISPLLDLREVYPPITLSFAQLATANHDGVVEAQIEGETNVWIVGANGLDFPAYTPDLWEPVTLDLSAFAGKQMRVRFHSRLAASERHWFVDDVTIRGVSNTVPVSPSVTGSFTGNSWSGNISLAAPGAGVVLVAVHSNGVFGTSAPLNVSAPNDLNIHTLAPIPNLQLGSTGSVNVIVSNTGPNTASGVIVTNAIPPNANLGNVAVSQGSSGVVGNQLLLNFGSIGGGGHALASFEFTATKASTLSWTSVVGHAGSEIFLNNNRSVASVNFGDPLVSVLPAWAGEDDTNIVVTFQLDAVAPVPVTVSFTTVSATATAGEDFVPTNGTVTFPPFTSQVQMRIAVIDDNLFEDHPNSFANDPPEFFRVQITSATNAAVDEPIAVCTLRDNDPVPVLTIITTNAVEGHAGANAVPVVLRMSGPVGKPTDIKYYTETGTAYHYDYGGYALMGTARANEDFVTLSNSFEFAPGETQRVIHVQFIGDAVTEPNEMFTLVLESRVLLPPVSIFRPTHFYAPVTIVDDDPPVLLADDYRITAETCSNNAVDPSETVTVLLRVRNAGYNVCASSNLVATLLPGGGVLHPSGPQNYGDLCGAADEWRPFTFTADAACGSNITATLAFADSGTNRGTSSVTIPVGQRGPVLSEDFDEATIPDLPPGWVANFPEAPWRTANEPPDVTNQFARVVYQFQFAGASSLSSPPFVVTSSNAWLRLRHRFEIIPVNAGGHLFLSWGNEYRPSVAQFSGSSRGWMTSLVPIPPESIGSTQRISFQLVRLDVPTAPTWEIDSVEVFDGPAACCDSAAPAFTSVRRTNSNVVLQWTSVSNRSYQVQFRPTLKLADSWTDFGPAVVANGPVTARTNAISGSNGFYRVKLNP